MMNASDMARYTNNLVGMLAQDAGMEDADSVIYVAVQYAYKNLPDFKEFADRNRPIVQRMRR